MNITPSKVLSKALYPSSQVPISVSSIHPLLMATSLGHHAALVAGVVMMAILCGRVVASYGAEGVHHMVGGDKGWDATTDMAAWSSGRVFRVGDNIWFAYSVATQGGIAELKSREEFYACDLTNPIRMYTDGLQKITLNGEGPRYFASSNSEECKNGLKLHVQVLRQGAEDQPADSQEMAVGQKVAEGPQSSGSLRACATSLLVWAVLCLIGFRSV